MVSQRRLRYRRSGNFLVSHLSCASVAVIQYQVTVKLYGVFPSSRGLIRIFTHSSISPGPLLRQRPNRYAIRAGRNLPDKEFRYLRTVIVTAAVHRGLNSTLRTCSLHLLLTFRHWAGVSPYTSACAFAETCVFGKQSLGPLHCGQLSLAPLLPKLRGHFAEFLNKGSPVRLGIFFSSTCVGLRYGHLLPYLAAFLASVDSMASLLFSLPFSAIAPSRRTSLSATTSPWTQISTPALHLSSCVTASFMRYSVVSDSLPIVHHLRSSAST